MRITHASRGQFFKIPIDEEFHTYGRLVATNTIAVYDFRTEKEETDLTKIAQSNILFYSVVHKSAFKEWEIIGVKELEDRFLGELFPFFSQSDYNLMKCFKISLDGLTKIPCKPEDCIGLDQLLIAEAEHVERRLQYHYQGKEYPGAEYYKVKIPPTE